MQHEAGSGKDYISRARPGSSSPYMSFSADMLDYIIKVTNSDATRQHQPTSSRPRTQESMNRMYQAFDQIGEAYDHPLPAMSESESLKQMQIQLFKLQNQVDYLTDQNRLLGGQSNATRLSQTLDASDLAVEVQEGPDSSKQSGAKKHLDICQWIRGSRPKTDVLYRRHLLSGSEPITSPLFRLQKPARVAELLETCADSEQPIAGFMSRHAAMGDFQPYVLDDAHTLQLQPQTALLNDQTSQHLPPLASEEYAIHIARLTYLVRSLQAIEVADPMFLSDPRTHLLLDLVLDLESKLTLPRVDFLRKHADTIRAMDTQMAGRDDTDYVVGSAGFWTYGAVPMRPELEHIRLMARAIPRYPATSHASNGNSNMAELHTRMFGAAQDCSHRRQRHDSGLCYDDQTNSAECPIAAVLDQDGTSMQENKENTTSIYMHEISSQQCASAEFDTKLHPVVGPKPMEVAVSMCVSADNVAGSSAVPGKRELLRTAGSEKKSSQTVQKRTPRQQPSPPGSERESVGK